MKKILTVSVILLVAVSMVFVGAGCKAQAAETTAAETTAAETTAAETTAAETTAAETTAAEEEYDPKDNPIAFAMVLRSHPSIQIMIGGFFVKAIELGYDPFLFAPDEYDLPKLYGLLEAGMAQHNIKGLTTFIFDESIAQYIKQYSDQGIPVVTGHVVVTDDMVDTYEGLTAWAACSPEEYGKESAMAIGEQVGGKGTVAITIGAFVPNEVAAADSFTKTMNENFPDIKVLEPEEEGFDTPTAIQRATAIMQANPDIVGAFSTTGAGPSTWAGAQKNTGKKIVAIGMDYTRVNLDLVKNGEIYAVVAQPLFEEFAKCAEMLDTVLRGGTVEFDNLVPAPLVTADKVDEYYEILDTVEEAIAKIQ